MNGNNHQAYVFHYTTASTALDFILPYRTLRLSSLLGVNDPKEELRRNFTFYARHPASVLNFSSDSFNEISKDVAAHSYVLCSSINQVGYEPLHGQSGMSGALKPRMWAHYGGNHGGICLVLNKELLHARIIECAGDDNFYYGDVAYFGPGELPPSIAAAAHVYLDDWKSDPHAYVDWHIENFNRGLFFSKSKDWCQESEYRWIIRSRKRGPFYVDISDCIVTIVLGSRVTPETTAATRSICEMHKIPLDFVNWLPDHGTLVADSKDPSQFNLDGISFSTNVPCLAVIARGAGGVNGPLVVCIDAKGGGRICPDGAQEDVDSRKNRLSWVTEVFGEVDEEVAPTKCAKFSAARLSQQIPFKITMVDGHPKFRDDEEMPLHGRPEIKVD
ncbi:DUF2971 domain-containing protein [Collimonas sp.]|jgi:hypothetical protein|uniref:DUF2971 domain-containing protein n=1 Tax=Collimonas sp. TaxID=1963772 RepID=UPI002B5FB6BC|nr:DUF2971 domain-containing protein [Collimonas sp.]HWW08546.1 DUF2971 domain-containing protein [Collimonas sp.]